MSAHDSDVVPMLVGLNFSSTACIEEVYRKGKTQALNCDSSVSYAASVIFELHSNEKKEFSVKIKKDGKYLYLCERKEVECSYAQWRERVMASFIDVDDVCNNPKNGMSGSKIGHDDLLREALLLKR